MKIPYFYELLSMMSLWLSESFSVQLECLTIPHPRKVARSYLKYLSDVNMSYFEF